MKNVKAIGDEKAARMLDEMGHRARDQRASMDRAGRAAQRSVSGVPVDTGRLRASMNGGPESELKVTPWGYELGTKVPYARFVFYGTESMPARPPHVAGDPGADAAALVNEDVAP